MTTHKKLFLVLVLAISSNSFSQSKKYILALSKGEKKVIVYDYKMLDTIAKIPVGEDPHEVVTSPDGSFAYISKPLMNDRGHEIAVLNLKTLQPEKIIDTKPFLIPHGLVYLKDQLWFTAQGSKVVGVFDVRQNAVKAVFGTGENFTHLLYVTPDGKRFYTTNVESGTLSIYEHLEIPPYMPPTGVLPVNAKNRQEWRQTLVNVGIGAEGFDVSPDGKELWTARPDGHIVTVDLETKKVTSDFDSKVLGLHRLKITPDGQTVCIVSVKTGDLLYYNRKTHKLEKQVNIGRGAGIYMDTESDRMFVSCTPDNYVVVIDLNTRKEIKRLEIGRPDGITSVIVK